MSDIVSEKTKDRGGTVKKQVFMQKQPSEGFFKKGVMRKSAKFTRNRQCRNLFFDKV